MLDERIRWSKGLPDAQLLSVTIVTEEITFLNYDIRILATVRSSL